MHHRSVGRWRTVRLALSCLLFAACESAPPTFTQIAAVNGAVLLAGSPDSGVRVALVGVDRRESTLTASDGQYWFWDLPAGMYEITPSYIGEAYRPTSRVVEYDGYGSGFHHFRRIGGPTHVIMGTAGASGVVVTLTGDNFGAALSRTDGAFVFPAVRLGAYTLTPRLPGRTFTPESVLVNGVIDFSTGSLSAGELLAVESVTARTSASATAVDASAFFEVTSTTADGRGSIRARRDSEVGANARDAYRALWQQAAAVEFVFRASALELALIVQLQPDRTMAATSADFTLAERLVGASNISFTINPP